jgi:hypothetical protein
VSFSEDCVRFGDRLARLIGAGVSVREGAAALGISRQRCYAILRARGRPIRSSGVGRGPADREQIVAVFTATGSVNQAAKSAGVSHSLARRLLVAEGLVSPARQPRGKAAARRRFLELIEAGWSASRAAREVGVHVRTAATVAPSVAVAVVVMLSVASVSDISGPSRQAQLGVSDQDQIHHCSDRTMVGGQDRCTYTVKNWPSGTGPVTTGSISSTWQWDFCSGDKYIGNISAANHQVCVAGIPPVADHEGGGLFRGIAVVASDHVGVGQYEEPDVIRVAIFLVGSR